MLSHFSSETLGAMNASYETFVTGAGICRKSAQIRVEALIRSAIIMVGRMSIDLQNIGVPQEHVQEILDRASRISAMINSDKEDSGGWH